MRISNNIGVKGIVVLMLCFLLVLSCKNRRKARKTDQNRPFVELAISDLLDHSQSNWQFYTAKAKVGLNERSVDAVIKMQKDSVVWISVSFFGIEGARIFMKKTSTVRSTRKYAYAHCTYISKKIKN